MTNTREQALYFPESMLREIKEEAARMDRSLSWCVYQAWVRARRELTRLEPLSTHPIAEERLSRDYAGEDKVKQTLFFPEPMLAEIQSEAKRQDRSLSFILQYAWCLAVDELKQLSSDTHDDDDD